MRLYFNAPRNFKKLADSLPQEIIQSLRQVPGWVRFHINLYQYIHRYHTLPYGGGLMNQSLRSMTILDIIEDEMSTFKEQSRLEREALNDARRRLHDG